MNVFNKFVTPRILFMNRNPVSTVAKDLKKQRRQFSEKGTQFVSIDTVVQKNYRISEAAQEQQSTNGTVATTAAACAAQKQCPHAGLDDLFEDIE